MLTAFKNTAHGVIRSATRALRASRPTTEADPLDTPLIYFSGHAEDALTVRDSHAGIFICGCTGSGKTSGSGAALARQYLSCGYGGLVLCAKVDERALWEKYAAQTGRQHDLMVFSPENLFRFNFLKYVASLVGPGGGLTENLVRLFITLLEAGEGGETKASEKFWERAVKTLLRNSIDAILLAREPLSVPNIVRLIGSAPRSIHDFRDERWRSDSYLLYCLEAVHRRSNLRAVELQNRAMVENYWLRSFPTEDERTRSNIVTTFMVMADSFCRGVLWDLFSTSLTIVPEHTHAGKIIVIDLPVKSYGEVGRYAAILWKYLYQQSCERRQVNSASRNLFLWADEAQEFINSHDFLFMSTARSSRVSTTYLTQTISAMHARLGAQGHGKALTDAILANFATKIFHAQADPESCRWAEELFARDWVQHASRNFSQSRDQNPQTGRVTVRPQVSTNISHSLDSRVLAGWFSQLRTGGPANQYRVEALIYGAGRRWRATNGQNWIKTVFSQR